MVPLVRPDYRDKTVGDSEQCPVETQSCICTVPGSIYPRVAPRPKQIGTGYPTRWGAAESKAEPGSRVPGSRGYPGTRVPGLPNIICSHFSV